MGDEGVRGVGECGGNGGFVGNSGDGPHRGNGPGGGNWRYKKLEMPIFDESDPDEWILRAERYYKFYGLKENEMLDAAVVAMGGDALWWWQ